MFKLIKEDHPGLKVVVLNACYTEPQAIAISTHDIYAIGVNDIYNSLPAKLFAAGFYWQYAEKPDDIRAAVRFGLRQALAENKISKISFTYFTTGNACPSKTHPK
ncbi:MAG: hypothetical protein IPI11_11935 [Haliscomenobacter sp.]|nr:hypothetical protein [Haliscomenobacter sp.]